VSPRRSDSGPDEDLHGWAAEHAPAVLARAQAEAVAILRDALVSAATRTERQPPHMTSPHRPAAAEPERPEQGELLWAYCVLRADDPHPADLSGVWADGAVEREEAAGLVALVSRVPRAQFAAEPLRRNLNDLAWLERVARSHERVLDATLAVSTIVPLRMCTLYETPESVRETLEREVKSFAEALETLDGRLEWAVKVLVDGERLMEAARPGVQAEPEREGRGEGGAYMQRRRHERTAREAASALAAEVAERVHARLQDWAIDAATRPPQNRELSGHLGEMVLNAAYLVERERTDELRQIVAELEQHHHELGIRIELTGPWPPYNFVSGGGAAALA
jgi:hypothetical protein